MTPALRHAIWIPGWACDARSLHPLVSSLGGELDHATVGWRDCLRDWRQGWGDPAPDAKQAQPANAVNDAGLPIALAERLAESPEPVVLVGWSLGGMLALRAAAAIPGAVAALILIGAPARFVADPDDPACLGAPSRPLRAMRRKLDSPDAVQQVLLDFFRAAGKPTGDEGLAAGLTVRATARFGQPALARGLDYLAAEDVRSLLPRVTAPCLVLHGEADGIVAPGWAAWLAGRLPGGQSRVFPGQGHLAPLTATAEAATAMRDFLASLSGEDGRA